jgi:tetratricopeptide (TPR) repeat protein
MKRLESLIYFNQNNPYLHQICGKIYFLKENCQKAEFYFDKALELNVKDGGWTLVTKALNNMFDAVISYDAVTSLEELLNREADYKLQISGEVQSGIFINDNEFGFSSFFIDLRNNESLGQVYAMMSACYLKCNLLYEANKSVEKAIELCPCRDDFWELRNDIQFKRNE